MSSSSSTTRHIPNARRLLILSPDSHSLSTIPDFLHSLTGVPVGDLPSAPSPIDTSATATTDDGPLTTSSTPDIPKSTFAGYTTHNPLQIRTKYYNADVPIWVDEIPLSTSTSVSTPSTTASATQWKTEFVSPDARVVRDVIGAMVVVLQNPEFTSPPIPVAEHAERGSEAPDPATRDDVKAIKDFLRAIGDVKGQVEEERNGDEVPGLLVLVERESKSKRQQKKVPVNGGDDEGEDGIDGPEEPFSAAWWEDQLFDDGLMGFEVICWDPAGREEEKRNQFGEFQGMRRIREVLETHEWADTSAADGDGSVLDDDLEEELLRLSEGESGFNFEVNELQREMVGLRMAIEHGGDSGDSDHDDHDDELQVESLEGLMLRMKAIRDMSADLPDNERKRFAAKAVRDIMKELE